MKVQEVMKTSLRISQYGSGLTAVARLMGESGGGVQPGVEIDLRVLQALANRDVRLRIAHGAWTTAYLLVGEVILGKFYACRPDHDISVALEIMRNARLHSLPVLDRRGGVRGVISISDLAQPTGLLVSLPANSMA